MDLLRIAALVAAQEDPKKFIEPHEDAKKGFFEATLELSNEIDDEPVCSSCGHKQPSPSKSCYYCGKPVVSKGGGEKVYLVDVRLNYMGGPLGIDDLDTFNFRDDKFNPVDEDEISAFADKTDIYEKAIDSYERFSRDKDQDRDYDLRSSTY